MNKAKIHHLVGFIENEDFDIFQGNGAARQVNPGRLGSNRISTPPARRFLA
jgi:hypothetical protein